MSKIIAANVIAGAHKVYEKPGQDTKRPLKNTARKRDFLPQHRLLPAGYLWNSRLSREKSRRRGRGA